jgi:hypothetical protein
MTRHKNGFGWEHAVFTAVVFVVFWMIIQFAGEQLKFLPIITLAMPAGATLSENEGLILFIVFIGVAFVLAALLAWAISRHKRK